jgi:hypothetical protein
MHLIGNTRSTERRFHCIGGRETASSKLSSRQRHGKRTGNWMSEPVTATNASADPAGSQHCWRKDWWPWLVMAAVMAVTAGQLRSQGRLWWCSCGQFYPWSGNVWSSHGSQHLFDPYTFTHILHGVILCGLLAWAWPKVSPTWRLCLAICIEALWEVFENTDFTIHRYRILTIALGYQGDTIANSLGDILSCGIGFALARRLGFWGSLGLFVGTETVLILWIGDRLLLDVGRLIFTR